jgi:pimeloyl-ACP methyl ester carboxylesterase
MRDFTRALSWVTTRREGGVAIRCFGEGQPIVVVPGMEGSGESCLHLVVPVAQRVLFESNLKFRVVLVDYSQESFATLEELIVQIRTLVREEVGIVSSVLWGQSFGNILALGALSISEIHLAKCLLVSAFTSLPALKIRLSAALLPITPQSLYTALIGPGAKWEFGPFGDEGNPPFLEAMKRARPQIVEKRTSWLKNRNFTELFRSNEAQTKIWLGSRDRLVNLSEQRSFFEQLSRVKSNYRFGMIDGSGHVALPSQIVAHAQDQLCEWLVAA